MSFRDGPFSDIKVPLTWAAGGAVVLALIAAVALLVSDRRETLEEHAYGRIRATADQIEAPVSSVLSAPVGWVRSGVNGIRGYFFAISDNRRLRAENKELRQVRDQLAAERDVNDRLRTILGLKTDPPIAMVTGRAITDARGPFAQSRLVNVGREAGVKVGNPAMSENGLVGRVVGTSAGFSRILLLTDIASRTPVMIDRNNARAILTGDGGANPRLAYLRTRDQPKVGDRLVTSGDGGVMPRGLPVGIVVKGVDGAWRAQLSSDRAAIDFVRILKFEDFGKLANERELAAAVMPADMGGAIPLPVIPVPKPPPPPVAAPGQPPAAAPKTAAPATAPAAAPKAPAVPAAAPKTATPTASPAPKAPATATPAPVATPPVARTTVPAAKTPAPPTTAPKAPAPKTAIKGPTTSSASGNTFRKVETPDRPAP